MKKKLYIQYENNFFDKIINKKRIEMVNLIKKNIDISQINDLLDIGTTEDITAKSSNIFCKLLDNIKIHKSISNQKITNKRFNSSIEKSITSDFNEDLIKSFKSDLVISSATIEHVGDFENQVIKVKNMISLSKKYIVLSTPNKFYPIEFHTKLPFVHWLPKKIFRKILIFLKMNYFADQNNLNLLSKKELTTILDLFSDKINYKIYNIRFLGLISNFFVICKLKNNF
tara:strand:- start:2408 stop:3091 length:684 start_codon:yes stop_codon:yes gene_type:complete